MRNPLVQRVFCVIRIGTLNEVTVRSVLLNSEEILWLHSLQKDKIYRELKMFHNKSFILTASE